MTPLWIQSALMLAVLLVMAAPLGAFVARVYEGERTWLTPVLGPVERLLYRASGVDPSRGMSWTTYGGAILAFSAAGTLLTYLVLRLQGVLPLNPQGFAAVEPLLAFNTACRS